jgi:hypothetical protein
MTCTAVPALPILLSEPAACTGCGGVSGSPATGCDLTAYGTPGPGAVARTIGIDLRNVLGSYTGAYELSFQATVSAAGLGIYGDFRGAEGSISMAMESTPPWAEQNSVPTAPGNATDCSTNPVDEYGVAKRSFSIAGHPNGTNTPCLLYTSPSPRDH